MPELPEVETIRTDLEKKILHKKITKLEIIKSKFSDEENKKLEKIVSGAKIKNIERYGKLLIFVLERNNIFLLIHLKMTGQLIYMNKNIIIGGGHSFKVFNKELPDKYTQAIFYFHDHSRLFFNDLRRFGYIKFSNKDEKEKIVERFGIEPLKNNFTFKNFSELLKNKKMILKALLMNQALIAGIGNIYADEICFCAGVLPHRKTTSLKDDEIKKLFLCSKSVLKKAIKYRGTTFNNYIDSDGNKGNFSKFLQVYGRKGKPCFKCTNLIQKKKLAGRGTHFCEFCQK